MEPEMKILLHAILIELQMMNNYKSVELAMRIPSEDTVQEAVRDACDLREAMEDIKNQSNQKYANMAYKRNVEVKQ